MSSTSRALSLVAVSLVVTPAGAEQTNAPAAKPASVRTETVAQGLEHPWGLAFLPDGRLLVTERPGRMRLVTKNGKLSAPIAGLPEIAVLGQGGLLDVALGPDFATSGAIYLSYAEPREAGKNGTSVARAKLVLEGDGGKLEDVAVIFRQEPAIKSTYHFGSRLVFARDGSLFITTGERNFARNEAQNPANHLGKVIHVMPDGAPAPDNPKLAGWDPKVWSIGHRNIQGAALDPDTGQLWTVEHGARGGDELNHPQAGKNYGWPLITYGRDYTGARIGEGTGKEGLEQPVYYWDPSIAVSGLAFYTADLIPEWKGNLFVGGLAGAHLERLVLEGEEVVAHEKLLTDLGERIRDVRQGPDGALWLLTDEKNGKVLRLVPSK
ncbi:MAG TPA: PQQ-dependent sugar dehydrogenase [Hyphomicrobiaceae bacterium]|nr:PQQ-dependent sugar dehydrogenase [Hyphomicrobiaceae bacterium]